MSFMHFDAHTAAAGLVSVNLSGTPGVPRTVSSFAIVGGGGSQTASAQWTVAGTNVPANSIAKGDMNKSGFTNASLAQFTSDNSATDWIVPKDFLLPYWVRASELVGDAPTFVSGDGSWPPGGVSQWVQVVPDSTNWTVRWSVTSSGFASTEGIVRVDIARDNGGSPGAIATSGYYRGIAQLEP